MTILGNIGSKITLSVVVTGARSIPYDPPTIALVLLDPTGVTTSLIFGQPPPQSLTGFPGGGIVRDGTGLYHYDFTPVDNIYAGDWNSFWLAFLTTSGDVKSPLFPFTVASIAGFEA